MNLLPSLAKKTTLFSSFFFLLGLCCTSVQANTKSAISEQATAQPEQQVTSAENVAKQYGPIKPSDTLWKIAKAHRPNNQVTNYQVMMAIFVANPLAFKQYDINGLVAGRYLTIPTLEQIKEIPRDREKADQIYLQIPQLKQVPSANEQVEKLESIIAQLDADNKTLSSQLVEVETHLQNALQKGFLQGKNIETLEQNIAQLESEMASATNKLQTAQQPKPATVVGQFQVPLFYWLALASLALLTLFFMVRMVQLSKELKQQANAQPRQENLTEPESNTPVAIASPDDIELTEQSAPEDDALSAQVTSADLSVQSGAEKEDNLKTEVVKGDLANKDFKAEIIDEAALYADFDSNFVTKPDLKSEPETEQNVQIVEQTLSPEPALNDISEQQPTTDFVQNEPEQDYQEQPQQEEKEQVETVSADASETTQQTQDFATTEGHLINELNQAEKVNEQQKITESEQDLPLSAEPTLSADNEQSDVSQDNTADAPIELDAEPAQLHSAKTGQIKAQVKIEAEAPEDKEESNKDIKDYNEVEFDQLLAEISAQSQENGKPNNIVQLAQKGEQEKAELTASEQTPLEQTAKPEKLQFLDPEYNLSPETQSDDVSATQKSEEYIAIEKLLEDSFTPVEDDAYDGDKIDVGLDEFPEFKSHDVNFDVDDDMQEVGAQLDLAQVYIEIGDLDNAKVILNNVLKQGNEKQQQQAKKQLEAIT
ncbi:FimV/HubP family polar landmark protein [Thalassotalea aquiviva]|uniref:FimV/HubP family polar landmark protein n=1 Tax=Thalassotalea aquiviva TaxID=3242415 RepID=UPI00352B4DB6